ncbi:MAG: serine hydrolase domain-containing protein [Planctomycetota bacterium]|jgi:CubicO group peptidase (beta-lactamase class C family)
MKRLRNLTIAAVFLLWASAMPVARGASEDGAAKLLPPCRPAEVGMDADVLAKIPERMRRFVDDRQITGAVTLVARRGRVAHLEAVGHADVEGQKPMKEDCLFAIASMTKPITATAVMILQDEGKLSVDDPVSKHIPRFRKAALESGPPAREITIRDLMTHTSGVGSSQRAERSLKETVDLIAKEPLKFEPGSRWQYGPGLNVCGRIIEVASGRPYDAFLEERVFRPLGMVDTTFHPTPAQRERLARIVKPGKDGKSIEPASHWLVDDAGQRAPNPSGGLFSTAADMARFYQMILGGGRLDGQRIVSQEAVEQMTRLQTGDLVTGFTPGNGWGLGWCVVRQPEGVTKMLSPGTFGHGGAFGTQGWVDPKRRMIFVLMIQRTGFGNSDGSDIRGAFQQIAVEAVR